MAAGWLVDPPLHIHFASMIDRSISGDLAMIRECRAAWAAGLVTLVLGVAPAPGQQVSESALKDRVAQLVERLESPKLETRAAAEKSLIDLGARVLPMLPNAVDKKKADLSERVERVRTALREKEEQTNLGASKVTIQGKGMRLTEAIKAIQTQSGNIITDLREANGDEVTNPAMDLEIVDKSFFEAFDILAEQAGVTYTPYTNDGTLGIMAGAMKSQPNMPAPPKPMVVYSGPFRIQFKEIAVVKDFSTAAGTATAQFDVMWEPRIRPMLLSVKNEDLKIVDDQGKPVMPQVSQEANETGLRAGNCAAEFNLNLVAPERAAKVLSSLRVKGLVTVPSGMKAFKFPNLGATNVVQKQGDISVTLESTEVDEQTWKVSLMLAYPEGGPAFETYRQGLFNNRPWLQKPDGSRFEHNGGANDSGSGDGKIGFEFMFVDAPGKPSDYMFVYETPAKVVPIPLEFEFKDVPLP
jgi:hypothetical protein